MKSPQGFSEKSWEIIRLGEAGLSPFEIQKRIKRSSVGAIRGTLCRARKAGVSDKLEEFKGGPGVVIQGRLYGYLHNEAKRRNVSAHDLVRMIVANVVDDDLFSAVLDK